MFTDFSAYSRQPKLIASFGASYDAQGVSGGMWEGSGKLPEGISGVESFDPNSGEYKHWANPNNPYGERDSADTPPEPDPEPKPEDPTPKPPERPRPPPETEDEARERRIRERQEASQREVDNARRAREEAAKNPKPPTGGGSGGGGSGGGQPPTPPTPPSPDQKGMPPTPDFSGKPTPAPVPDPSGKPYDSRGTNMFTGDDPVNYMQTGKQPSGGGSIGGGREANFAPQIAPQNKDGSTIGGRMETNFALQSTPAYAGQSGSSPATYPAVGTTTPSTSSGASAWVTDYNSIGFMDNDPIMGGTYSAPSGGNFSTTQGTDPASQVGIANPVQQSIYDTFTNVTGAGNQVYMGGSPSFNEATGQYTNVTRNPIANPNTLPTTLSTWDLFGTAGASSGLFLDTPTIKQNAVATTPEVDGTAEPEPVKEGGGLGLAAIGFIALKLLSVI